MPNASNSDARKRLAEAQALHRDAAVRLDEQRKMTAEAEERIERLRRGAQTLGHIVEQNGRMILDITGLHDWIDDDGDGDWGAVWDNAYALRPRIAHLEGTLARVAALADDLERGSSLMWSSTVAKAIREALDGAA